MQKLALKPIAVCGGAHKLLKDLSVLNSIHSARHDRTPLPHFLLTHSLKFPQLCCGRMKRDQNSRHKVPMNPSERIDRLIAKLTDWRGKTLASVRESLLEADREIIEEWKWMG